MVIPDSWLSSSSKLNANTPGKNGRLNYTAGSSWCASSSDNYPYLEINLQILHIICAISTQGNHQADQWVKTFSLQTSTDGRTWTNYTEDNQVSIKVNTLVLDRIFMLDYKSSHPINFDQLSVLFALDFCVLIYKMWIITIINKGYDP